MKMRKQRKQKLTLGFIRDRAFERYMDAIVKLYDSMGGKILYIAHKNMFEMRPNKEIQ